MPKTSILNMGGFGKLTAVAALGSGATVVTQKAMEYYENSPVQEERKIAGENNDQKKKFEFEVQKRSEELEKKELELKKLEAALTKQQADLKEQSLAVQKMQAAATEAVAAEAAVVETVKEVAQAAEPANVQPEAPKADAVPTDNTPRRPAVFDGGNKEADDEKKKSLVIYGSDGDVVTRTKEGPEVERLRKELENLRQRLAQKGNPLKEEELRKREERLRERERALLEMRWERNMQSKTGDPLLEAAFGGSDPFNSKKLSKNDASGENTKKNVVPIVKKKEDWKGSSDDFERFNEFIKSVESNDKASPEEIKRKTIMEALMKDVKKPDEKENAIIRDLEVDVEEVADETGAMANFLKYFPEYKNIRSYGLLVGAAGKLVLDTSMEKKTLTVEDLLQALRNSVSQSAPRILNEVENAPQVTEDDSLSQKREQQRSTHAKLAGEYTGGKGGAIDPSVLVNNLKKETKDKFEKIFDNDGFIGGKEGKADIRALTKIIKDITGFVFKPVKPVQLDAPDVVVATDLPGGEDGNELRDLLAKMRISGGVPPPPRPPAVVPVIAVTQKIKKPSEKAAGEEMPNFSCDVRDAYDSETIRAFLQCDPKAKAKDQDFAKKMKELWDGEEGKAYTDAEMKKRDAEYEKAVKDRQRLQKSWLNVGKNKELGIQWRLCSNRGLKDSSAVDEKIKEIEEFLVGKNPESPVDEVMLRAAGKMNDANANMLKAAYKLCTEYRTLEKRIKERTKLFKDSKSSLDLWEEGLKIETKADGSVNVSLPDLKLLDNEVLYSLLWKMVGQIVSLDIQSVSPSSASEAFGQFFNLCPHLKQLKRLKITACWGSKAEAKSFFNQEKSRIENCKLTLPTPTNEGMFLSAIAVIPGLEELELVSTLESNVPKLDNSKDGIQYWTAAIERCKTVKLPYFSNVTPLLDQIRRLKDIDHRERYFEFRVSEKSPLDRTLAGGLFEEVLRLIVAGKGKVSVGFSGPFNNSQSKTFSIAKALCGFGVRNFREEMFTLSEKKVIKDPKTNEEHVEITEGVDEKWLAFLGKEEKFSNGEKGDVRICKPDTLTYDEISKNLEDWLRVLGIPTKEFAEEVMKLYVGKNAKTEAVHAMVEKGLKVPMKKQEAEKNREASKVAQEEAEKKREYNKTHANYDDFKQMLEDFPVYICGAGVYKKPPTTIARLISFEDYMGFFFAAFLSHLDGDLENYYFFDTKVFMGNRAIGMAFPGFANSETFPKKYRASGRLNKTENAEILDLAIQHSKEFAGKKGMGAYDQVAELLSLRDKYEKITLEFNQTTSPEKIFFDMFGGVCDKFPKFVQAYTCLKGLQYNVTVYHQRERKDKGPADSKLLEICKDLIKAKAHAEEFKSLGEEIEKNQKELASLSKKTVPSLAEKEKKAYLERWLPIYLPILEEKREECSKDLRNDINGLVVHKKYLAGFVELIARIKSRKTPTALVRVNEDGSLEDGNPAFKVPNFGNTGNVNAPTGNSTNKNTGNVNAPTGNSTNKNSVISLLKPNIIQGSKVKQLKISTNFFKKANSGLAIAAWRLGGRKVKYMKTQAGNYTTISDVLTMNEIVVPPTWCPKLQYADKKKKILRALGPGETPDLDLLDELVVNGKVSLKQEMNKAGKPINGSYYVQFQITDI